MVSHIAPLSISAFLFNNLNSQRSTCFQLVTGQGKARSNPSTVTQMHTYCYLIAQLGPQSDGLSPPQKVL